MMLTVSVGIGLATSWASVSTSVVIQMSARTVADRASMTAVNRISGIGARILLPLAISSAGEERLLSRVIVPVACALAGAAAYLWHTSPSATTRESGKKTSARTATKTTEDDQHDWTRLTLYCLFASLPNTAGGLLRSLLGPHLMQSLGASAEFFSGQHAAAQASAVLSVALVSRVLGGGGGAGRVWGVIFAQACTMSVCATVIGCVHSSLFSAVAYILFRAVEESAKVSNTLLLAHLCAPTMLNTPVDDNKRCRAAQLARGIALQKLIGSALKISASLMYATLVGRVGLATAVWLTGSICGVGACGLGALFWSERSAQPDDRDRKQKTC